MIRIYHKNTKQREVEVLENFQKGTWVYVESPTQAEIQDLAEKLSLEEGHLRDALDINEVPRIEKEDGAIYVFTRFAYTENDQIETAPLLIVLKKNYFITLSSIHFPRLEKFRNSKQLVTTINQSRLLISILSQTMMSYNDYINIIAKKVRVSTINLEKVKNRDIVQFVQYENVLNDFILALVRSNTIIHSFLPGKIISFNDEEHDLLEDVSLYNGQLIQISNENLRTIVNIREAYSTIMTNNLNQIIKLFTSLTVILAVPVIIATFYGMNVKLPFEDHPLAFHYIVVISLIIVGISIIIFRKRDWL